VFFTISFCVTDRSVRFAGRIRALNGGSVAARVILDCTAVNRRAYGLRGLPLKPHGSRPGASVGTPGKTPATAFCPYAAICFDIGVVRISIRRGSADAATGAVISSTPF